MTTEAAKSKTPGDWPTLLKDNARTGGQGQHPARSPERSVWQFRTGSSVRSAPILEDGILYVTSVNGVLHAIDVVTGTSKWKFQAAGQVHSTPSLSANRILFGCDDGKVYALDRHAGSKLWESPTGAEGFGAAVVPTAMVPESERATFQGIVRADGSVATRNYIGIITSVNCSATTAKF